MALTIVNSHVPTLSWRRKSSPNNSVFGKPKISPTISKRCNSLQIKGLISSDNVALSEDEIAHNSFPSLDHNPHNSFPSGFVFGSASASFQVEGATKDEGRGPSIWDTFCEKFPGKIADKSNGEPGAGSYHHYKDDVKLLADIGLKVYKFSISWSRVLPKGRGEPNKKGIQYYNNLIDELLRYGIEPYVTLFHWDFPQALEDEYGGFLSRRVVEDYKDYANLCFKEFGHKVKHWITMNEPSMFCPYGYGYGVYAPGHCTPDLKIGESDFICPTGDSIREPYKVAHNILLAHAEVANLYKNEYKNKYGGEVGMILTTEWFEPYDNSPLNREAQQRALEFRLGWFMDPLKFGNYPFSMRALVGDRLPIFTEEESTKLKDSFDFIGLNYYTALYARDKPYNFTFKPQTCNDDGQFDGLVKKGNVPIGPAEPNSWVSVYPRGLTKLLLYIKERYNNPPIYITENGVLQHKNQAGQLSEKNLPALIDDTFRSDYLLYHLQAIESALSSRVDVKGYFVWSLLDSFEWRDGYTTSFGLTYVDNNQKRIPKHSAIWLKRFLTKINEHKVLPDQLIKEEALPVVVVTSNNP